MKIIFESNNKNYLKNFLRFFILILYLSPTSVMSNEDNTYIIDNVKIDIVSKDPNMTREFATERAMKKAFRRLLTWILTQNNYNQLLPNEKIIDELEIKKFVSGYQIKHEIFNNNNYIAEFSIMFDKRFVRQWLVKNKVNYLEKKTPTVLVIPISELNKKKVLWDDPNLWRLLWQNQSEGKNFIPMIFPHGDAEDLISLSYEDVNLLKIDKLTNFASRYGLSYILIPSSKIILNNKDHYLGVFGATIISEVKKENFFDEKVFKSFPGEILDDFLLRAINIISDEFDDYWLESNKQRAKRIYIDVFYSSLNEWRLIMDTLQNLSEINEVKILSLSLGKANLEAYISIRKESDLLRLMQSYRFEIKANSDMDNKYDVRISSNVEKNKDDYEIDTKQFKINSDILVIE